MTSKTPIDAERRSRILAELHRDIALRQNSYRERALKIYPHICARCGRELSGKRLSELTVHHKDNDHSNNPPAGSNWELLCQYCHDHEHDKHGTAGYYNSSVADDDQPSLSIFKPFEGLEALKPTLSPPATNARSYPPRIV